MSDTTKPNAVAPAKKATIDAYYDPAKKSYLVRDNDENWICVDQGSMKVRLAQVGYGTKRGTQGFSECDAALVEIQNQRSVVYVGPLAGYKRGCYTFSGYKVLVTHNPDLIKPEKGEWPLLFQVIENQLKDPDHPEQAIYFYGWVKMALMSLYNGDNKYGQGLVLTGVKGCGKSLLQTLITLLLGGRAAKPYRYMMGFTQFNRELFNAEHQMIEDEAASTDPRVRQKFGSAIKIIAATHEHSCHGKGREAIILPPFWRLTISINDEPHNLMILPPIEESLRDKLIILRSIKHAMPMPTETPEQERLFMNALKAELPAFVHWILHEFEIPANLRSDRYGIAAFINSHILAAIDTLSPHTRMLALIDQVFWTVDSDMVWKGTAEEAENLLHNSSYKAEASKLLSWAYAGGAYLGDLAKHRPERVRRTRTATARLWEIAHPSYPFKAEGVAGA